MTDLASMTLAELKKLERDVARAIANFEDRSKSAARAEIEALAKARGFKLSDLLDAAPVSGRKVASPPKYVHPENPSLTWTGRGRKPAWIVEGLAAGKSLEAFLIAA